MKTKERKNKKGISLIVLVITIIVIVILAVAVILTLVNNNPIENANKAKFQNDLKAMEEEVNLYETDKYTEANITGGTYTPTTVEGENMVDMFPSTSNYEDKVKVENGKLVIIEDALSEKEKEWASEIGFAAGGEVANTPVIPTGFRYLEGTVDTGYVIVNETDGNEFVWVPVPEGTFVLNNKFNEEPYSGANQEEISEYEAMKTSVEEYGGFYVGRYEASNDGSGKAQSKKNKMPWNYISWGNSMTDLKGGAVEKARAVYPESEVKLKGEAISTLVYGAQWDATVRWLKITYPIIETDSFEYGNYENDNLILTGSVETYKLNNIYDLAGNVQEWTMEASGNSRSSCGGFYRW